MSPEKRKEIFENLHPINPKSSKVVCLQPRGRETYSSVAGQAFHNQACGYNVITATLNYIKDICFITN